MNQTGDRCGSAVQAAYRLARQGELYLCRHCTTRLRPALSAQGRAIWPVSQHQGRNLSYHNAKTAAGTAEMTSVAAAWRGAAFDPLSPGKGRRIAPPKKLSDSRTGPMSAAVKVYSLRRAGPRSGEPGSATGRVTALIAVACHDIRKETI